MQRVVPQERVAATRVRADATRDGARAVGVGTRIVWRSSSVQVVARVVVDVVKLSVLVLVPSKLPMQEMPATYQGIHIKVRNVRPGIPIRHHRRVRRPVVVPIVRHRNILLHLRRDRRMIICLPSAIHHPPDKPLLTPLPRRPIPLTRCQTDIPATRIIRIQRAQIKRRLIRQHKPARSTLIQLVHRHIHTLQIIHNRVARHLRVCEQRRFAQIVAAGPDDVDTVVGGEPGVEDVLAGGGIVGVQVCEEDGQLVFEDRGEGVRGPGVVSRCDGVATDAAADGVVEEGDLGREGAVGESGPGILDDVAVPDAAAAGGGEILRTG